MRAYRQFAWKDSHFRICSGHVDLIMREIVRLRTELEAYIGRHPAFLNALEPIEALPDAPAIARHMAWAAQRCGVGPMAAVAGAIAQHAAEAALHAGAREAIVENGGDIYLASPEPVEMALYAGRDTKIAGRLALAIGPERLPLAVCSSSSAMGHSLSFGNCNLATVVAKDAALADAAATLACNSVHRRDDLEPTLARVMGIAGITGLILVKGAHVGLAGDLPALVRNTDRATSDKITRDRLGRQE